LHYIPQAHHQYLKLGGGFLMWELLDFFVRLIYKNIVFDKVCFEGKMNENK
jgi:hypothetical protein